MKKMTMMKTSRKTSCMTSIKNMSTLRKCKSKPISKRKSHLLRTMSIRLSGKLIYIRIRVWMT
jgi:hypothetical protein